MTHDELVDEVRAGAGIDVDQAATRVSRWINHLIRVMARRSEWIRGTPELGPTVANQAAYSLPSNVVKIRSLRVGDGSPSERVSLDQLWGLQGGTLQQGDTPFFAEQYDDAGNVQEIVLAPTPSTAGDSIEAYASLFPQDISGTAEPPFPEDFHMPIAEGGIAIGLRRGDEDFAGADPHMAIFDQACEDLRRLANARVTSRNQRILITGYDF